MSGKGYGRTLRKPVSHLGSHKMGNASEVLSGSLSMMISLLVSL